MMARTSLLLAALLLAGCASAELSSVRGDLARQVPEANIADGRSYSFGPVTLGLARVVTRMAGVDSEEARAVLRGVRRVKVAHYAVTGEVRADELRMPNRLRRYVDRGGWEHLATFRSGEEAVWVLYRARGRRITDVFVTVLSDDELVLTRVSGDLTGIVMDLMANRDLSLGLGQ